MTTLQKRVTAGFGVIIGAVMAWGLGTYAWLWHKDATAPPGVLSERAFLSGIPTLILASLVSVLIALVWVVCFLSLREE